MSTGPHAPRFSLPVPRHADLTKPTRLTLLEKDRGLVGADWHSGSTSAALSRCLAGSRGGTVIEHQGLGIGTRVRGHLLYATAKLCHS